MRKRRGIVFSCLPPDWCATITRPFLSAPNGREHTQTAARTTTAGHLSVYVEGAHPDGAFLLEREPKRMGFAVGGSAVVQIVLFALLILASRYKPAAAPVFALLPENPSKDIIWLSEPGPGGGGGGGGNKMKEPPRKAELPGKDNLTVPVEKAPKLEPVPDETDRPSSSS